MAVETHLEGSDLLAVPDRSTSPPVEEKSDCSLRPVRERNYGSVSHKKNIIVFFFPGLDLSKATCRVGFEKDPFI